MATKKKTTVSKTAKRELVEHVSDKSFLRVVGKSKLPVLVEFSAKWCGPCRALGKVLPAIADKYADRVKVVAVDLDDCPRTTTAFKVEAVPTLVLFKAGRPVGVEEGFATRRQTEAWLEKALKVAEKPAPRKRRTAAARKPPKRQGC